MEVLSGVPYRRGLIPSCPKTVLRLICFVLEHICIVTITPLCVYLQLSTQSIIGSESAAQYHILIEQNSSNLRQLVS
jgi:hypothetical protein